MERSSLQPSARLPRVLPHSRLQRAPVERTATEPLRSAAAGFCDPSADSKAEWLTAGWMDGVATWLPPMALSGQTRLGSARLDPAALSVSGRRVSQPTDRSQSAHRPLLLRHHSCISSCLQHFDRHTADDTSAQGIDAAVTSADASQRTASRHSSAPSPTSSR